MQTLIRPLLAGILLLLPVPSYSEENPTLIVVELMAYASCYARFGIITNGQAVDALFDFSRQRYQLDEQQVGTIMSEPGFVGMVNSQIRRLGGCAQLVERYKSQYPLSR